MRELDTKKFLQTDLNEYLAKDEHVTCISCQKCVKHKDKIIQFKYQRGLKSSYADTFANGFGNHKMNQFNLDKERRNLKVPYKPPRTFVTTNGANLVNTKGSGMIGAMTESGRGYVRAPKPLGETEKQDVQSKFVNNSSYQMTYPVYEKLPEANRRP